ncbi:DUF92 domain-containing protein [Hymenobacter chitinivorans]|uniref:Uncharacterized protein (TIGR00297 family) n=1 Tax=Hymenobacter chitinivorans DSM 11115 TaxID=1121954 RepID=A0A2M9BSY2_9BACT|nr:DUF92 domain-containing protein [Hymenobacter chitinivorans]PJJ61070.1 uncharacterized protein (TIGR00297 family) [Hymenobacter chitinivorans DSM 11115]
MTPVFQWTVLLAILLPGMAWSVRAGKLTVAAGLTGGVLGILIFLGAGFWGVGELALFFALGTGASAWKVAEKRRLGLAEENKGRRTTGQALANGGVAALTGLLAWWWPAHQAVFQLMLAGSFAAATADTLSSELGNVYGRRYYNAWTWRPDTRGLNGVVSLEGTLLGLAGSGLIAVLYCLGVGWSRDFVWLLVAGTAGNLADSLLGATVERRAYLSNNAVNTLNTAVGALTAALLYWLL